MAESQKGGSSPVNLKEKSSLLDMDFGKDFLSSWKSMSAAEDDAMDFDFGPVAKGKKKAFNFDQLDVDFSLDSDLGKISSFKVDISDLDISSPSKKSAKPKERSKEESASGNNQQKQDRFTFPFDFDDLDSFNFEPSLMKQEKKVHKNQDIQEASNKKECQGSGIDMTDGISVSEAGLKSDFAASGGVTNAKIENQVGGLGDVDSVNKNFPSNSVSIGEGPSRSATIQNRVASEEEITLLEKSTTRTKVDRDKHHQQENKISREPSSPESMEDLSTHSVSENGLTHDTVSEVQVEACSVAPKITGNEGEGHIDNSKQEFGVGPNCEYSQSECPPPQHLPRSLSNDGESNRNGSPNNVLPDIIDGTEPAQGDSEDISTNSVPGESLFGTMANRDYQNEKGELHLAPLSSRTSAGTLIQMKEKETSVIQSKHLKRSYEKEYHSQQTPSTQTKLATFSGKTIGSRVGTEVNVQSGSKLASIATVNSGEQNKCLLGSAKSVKGFKGVGELLIADGALNEVKLIGSSKLHDRDVTMAEPTQGSVTKAKNLITLSSCFNPPAATEKANNFRTQNFITPTLTAPSMVCIKNTNNIGDEGNKISPFKVVRSLPDLSSLKISRPVGVDTHPSNAPCQKQIKSLRNTMQNMELQGKAASKIAHAIGTEKHTPPTPSLKRKTFEASKADMLNINPTKRLSQSPTESRNVRELPGRVVDTEFCNHEYPTDRSTNSVSKDCQISGMDVSREVNMKELQITFAMGNDDTVGKAEAYTKELEDICNMLKKKHDEAKDVLVRAIINNNNLLMLNHPVYEEKILKVQKFAAQLMCKELQA